MSPSPRLVQNNLFSFILEKSRGGVWGTCKAWSSHRGAFVWGILTSLHSCSRQSLPLAIGTKIAFPVPVLFPIFWTLRHPVERRLHIASFEGEGVAAVTREEAGEHVAGPCWRWDRLLTLQNRSRLASSANPQPRTACVFLICLRAYTSSSQGPKTGLCSQFTLLPVFLTFELKCHMDRSRCWLIWGW